MGSTFESPEPDRGTGSLAERAEGGPSVCHGCWALVLLVCGMTLYWPGLRGPYYSDDLGFVFIPYPPSVLHYFTHPLPAAPHAYRPIEAALLIAIQRRFGFETWPVHAASLAAHLTLCFVVYASALRLGMTRLQAATASLLMLVAQTNAPAVLGNDTVSQTLATLFGCLSVYLALRAAGGRSQTVPRTFRRVTYYLSVLAFGIAMFAKETSPSFFIMIGIVFLLAQRRTNGPAPVRLPSDAWPAAMRSALLLAPYAALASGYVAARFHVGLVPSSGEGTYNVMFGMNVLRNLGMFAVAVITPVSSVTTMLAARGRDAGVLALVLVSSATYVAMAAGGWACAIRRTRDRGAVPANEARVGMGPRFMPPVLLGFAIAALFPAILLNHVSELYAYNAMPFFCLVAGGGTGALIRCLSHNRIALTCVCAALVALLLVNAAGVQQKARLMDANGRRTSQYMLEVSRYFPRVPDGGRVLLVNPHEGGPEYSVYLVRGFDVFGYGGRRFPRFFGRPDIRVQIVEEDELAEALESGPAGVVLGLSDGGRRVEEYNPGMR